MFLVWSAVFLHLTLCACVRNVSQKCIQDTKRFLSELRKDRPDTYAALMYDAFGKMGSDVEGGNVNRPGSLQECLLVRGPGFSGKYCQVFVKQEPIWYVVGVCVPDSCEEGEVETLAVYDVFQKDKKSLIPPIPSALVSQSTQGIYMAQCLTRGAATDFSTVICLCVCCALIGFPLVATVYVAFVRWRKRTEVCPGVDIVLKRNVTCYGTHPSNGAPQTARRDAAASETARTERGDAEEESPDTSKYQAPAFSLQRTSAAVLSAARAEASYASLNGIRVLSLMWILSGHSVQLSAWNNLDNDKRWKETVDNNPLYIFAFSGPVYLAVDTFLLIGGLLSAKSFLNSIQKAEEKFTLGLVASFIFKRFQRVQPLHLFIVCLAIGFFSAIPKGSFWFIAEDEILNCKKYWWSNLLLINNLFTVTDICAPWTWYLSIDFQFYLTTPLLIFIYRLNRHALFAVAVILLVLSGLTSALLTAFLHLPVHQPTTLTYEAYFQYYYNKPYTRYGPYLVGILAGIFMKTKKDSLLKRQWQAVVGWVSALAVMALLVGLAYTLRSVPDQPSAPHALYQGLHRTLWALAVAWIILACEEGYGGFVCKILSLQMWIPLSNISFACYLIHPILIILYNGIQETPMHYTDMNFFYLFMGHSVLTLIWGYVLTVLIERPYLSLKGHQR